MNKILFFLFVITSFIYSSVAFSRQCLWELKVIDSSGKASIAQTEITKDPRNFKTSTGHNCSISKAHITTNYETKAPGGEERVLTCTKGIDEISLPVSCFTVFGEQTQTSELILVNNKTKTKNTIHIIFHAWDEKNIKTYRKTQKIKKN